jgi:YVTN family beta-propeller protein
MTMQRNLLSCSLLRLHILAALLCAILAAPALLTAQQPYKVIDQWKIGGDGGWDYLQIDPPAHRLYITRGARVDVVDTQTGKLTGAINGLHGTHGVALDPSGKLGYVSDGGGNAVVVFDRATLATVATIPAGTNPDGILFDPATSSVWAFNGRSKDATVIDSASQKAVATIALPGKPEFPASDGRGSIYVNIEDKSEIVRLDARAHTITATWPLTGCESPTGLAMDIAGSRLFSVCDGKKMAVTDAKTGASLATPDIGDGPDAAGYSTKLKLAYSSNSEGTLTVVDAGKPGYPTIQTLPTQRSARTMIYDPSADRIYTVAAEFGPRPAPTADNPRPRPAVLPGSFTIIVIGR